MSDNEKTSNDLAEDRTDLAEDRTDWAEDRTIMANERTFAGWMRTGLASVGIGLGFNALFGKLEPTWVPKAIATMFILVGIFIFWAAQRNGCEVQVRMNAHRASPIKPTNLRLVAGLMALASFLLAIGMWTIDLPD
ncbi:YidH family protein [Qipengyuania nanhaisediminis]|uniref:YidH family protein n=1 Tax=Qipengyuania nanhaisediminis TaxID=604088 RepID=UPI0038B25ED2